MPTKPCLRGVADRNVIGCVRGIFFHSLKPNQMQIRMNNIGARALSGSRDREEEHWVSRLFWWAGWAGSYCGSSY